MGCTGTCLSHTAGPRWIGGWNGLRLAILLGFCLVLAPRLKSQVSIQSLNGGPSFVVVSGPDSVHGTVINGKTHEPIARALVYSPDNRYATLTDDRGHFEFKFPPPEKSTPPVATSGSDAEGMRKVQQWYARNARPNVFFARRPGFLQDPIGARVSDERTERAEIVITLEPEAFIVGRVQLPGVDNTDRIQLELYRQDFEEGHERWSQVSQFTTWASGEFRFSELAAGTYKLFTVEQTERDSPIFNPGDQLYGFPPVFYANASNFSSATPIRLAAGATVQANLAVARREYYPVKIGVANLPAGVYPGVEVFLRGHPGPGYSLGYDPSEQVVQGSLPDGGYTLKLFSQGEAGSSGSLSFTVRGGPVEGPVVSLYPNVSLSVNITREFPSVPNSTGTFMIDGTHVVEGSPFNASILISPVEQFGMAQAVGSQPAPGESENGMILKNVAPGTYWMKVMANNCYAASATWGGADVLHHPLVVGPDGASPPIEVTLRNDGAEVSGSVKLPQEANSQIQGTGATAFIYFMPLGELSGQFRQTQAWQNGAFDEMQIPPGSYRMLAFDHPKPELGSANAELLRKYESKGMVVELSASQTLRLSSPLALVSEQ